MWAHGTDHPRFERRRLARWLGSVVLALHPVVMAAQPGGRPAAGAASLPVDAARAFDFMVGLWTVEDRRSKRPLAGQRDAEVEITRGVSTWRALAGRVALLEEYELERPGGERSHGATVLEYAAAARHWSVHSFDFSGGPGSRSATGGVPCEGGPGRCVGQFVGSETIDGRVVLAREQIRVWNLNQWTWERLVSPDGGLRWETVRHRYYLRTARDSAPAGPIAAAMPRPARTAYCCSQMELRRYVASKAEVRALEELFREENRVGRAVGIQEQLRSGLAPDSAGVEVYWMQNLALLRDIDRPDSYVWLRGITVNASTDPSPFYLSPTWSQHQDAVRRAGVRSPEAHLLMTWGYPPGFLVGAPTGEGTTQGGLLVATIYTAPDSKLMALDTYFTSAVVPLLHATGGRPVASFQSVTGWRWQAHIAQAFGPTSPPDTGVFVWFARFPDAEAHRRHLEALQRDTTWQQRVQPGLQQFSSAPVQVWRLAPLPGSRAIY